MIKAIESDDDHLEDFLERKASFNKAFSSTPLLGNGTVSMGRGSHVEVNTETSNLETVGEFDFWPIAVYNRFHPRQPKEKLPPGHTTITYKGQKGVAIFTRPQGVVHVAPVESHRVSKTTCVAATLNGMEVFADELNQAFTHCRAAHKQRMKECDDARKESLKGAPEGSLEKVCHDDMVASVAAVAEQGAKHIAATLKKLIMSVASSADDSNDVMSVVSAVTGRAGLQESRGLKRALASDGAGASSAKHDEEQEEEGEDDAEVEDPGMFDAHGSSNASNVMELAALGEHASSLGVKIPGTASAKAKKKSAPKKDRPVAAEPAEPQPQVEQSQPAQDGATGLQAYLQKGMQASSEVWLDSYSKFCTLKGRDDIPAQFKKLFIQHSVKLNLAEGDFVKAKVAATLSCAEDDSSRVDEAVVATTETYDTLRTIGLSRQEQVEAQEVALLIPLLTDLVSPQTAVKDGRIQIPLVLTGLLEWISESNAEHELGPNVIKVVSHIKLVLAADSALTSVLPTMSSELAEAVMYFTRPVSPQAKRDRDEEVRRWFVAIIEKCPSTSWANLLRALKEPALRHMSLLELIKSMLQAAQEKEWRILSEKLFKFDAQGGTVTSDEAKRIDEARRAWADHCSEVDVQLEAAFTSGNKAAMEDQMQDVQRCHSKANQEMWALCVELFTQQGGLAAEKNSRPGAAPHELFTMSKETIENKQRLQSTLVAAAASTVGTPNAEDVAISRRVCQRLVQESTELVKQMQAWLRAVQNRIMPTGEGIDFTNTTTYNCWSMQVRSVALTEMWRDPDFSMDEATVGAMLDEKEVVAKWASSATALARMVPKKVEVRAEDFEQCLQETKALQLQVEQVGFKFHDPLPLIDLINARAHALGTLSHGWMTEFKLALGKSPDPLPPAFWDEARRRRAVCIHELHGSAILDEKATAQIEEAANEVVHRLAGHFIKEMEDRCTAALQPWQIATHPQDITKTSLKTCAALAEVHRQLPLVKDALDANSVTLKCMSELLNPVKDIANKCPEVQRVSEFVRSMSFLARVLEALGKLPHVDASDEDAMSSAIGDVSEVWQSPLGKIKQAEWTGLGNIIEKLRHVLGEGEAAKRAPSPEHSAEGASKRQRQGDQDGEGRVAACTTSPSDQGAEANHGAEHTGMAAAKETTPEKDPDDSLPLCGSLAPKTPSTLDAWVKPAPEDSKGVSTNAAGKRRRNKSGH